MTVPSEEMKMVDTSKMMVKFAGVVHDDKAPEGPLRGARFASNWRVGDHHFRVSSVENEQTTETMVFRLLKDKVDYFDLWADREFRSNASQHAKFLQEFLESPRFQGLIQ